MDSSQKRKINKRRAAGLCGRCGELSPNHHTCEACKQKARELAAAYRQRKRDEGICIKCGTNPVEPPHVKCNKCLAYQKKLWHHKIAEGASINKCARCRSDRIEGHRYCEVCYLKHIAAKRLGAAARWQEIQSLFQQQDGKCSYSGLSIRLGVDADLDHRVPVSKGGTNEIENLQWVHDMANTMKWHYTEDEFLNMVRLIAARSQLE